MRLTYGELSAVMRALTPNIIAIEAAIDTYEEQISELKNQINNSGYLEKIKNKMNEFLASNVAGREYEIKFYSEQLAHEREVNVQMMNLVTLKSKANEYFKTCDSLVKKINEFQTEFCNIDMIEEPNHFDTKRHDLYIRDCNEKINFNLANLIKIEDVDQVQSFVESFCLLIKNAKNDGILRNCIGIDYAKKFLDQLEQYRMTSDKPKSKDVVADQKLFKPKLI